MRLDAEAGQKGKRPLQTIVMMLVVVSPLAHHVTQAMVSLPRQPGTVEECIAEAEQFLRENPDVVPARSHAFYTCGPRG
jgi:hypothetical protein